MGLRGPLPQSNVTPLPARSHAGSDPRSATEPPRPKPVMPRQPPGMTSKAKTVWKHLAEPLLEAGQLSVVDGFTLALACESYCTAREARAQMDEHGVIVADAVHGGAPKKHPAAQVFRDQTEMFVKMCQELGLSPKARLRMASTAKADADPDADVFDA